MNFHILALITILVYLLSLNEYRKLAKNTSSNSRSSKVILFLGSFAHLLLLFSIAKVNLIYSPLLISCLSYLLIVVFLVLDIKRKNLATLGIFVISLTLLLLLIAGLFFHLENSNETTVVSASVQHLHWIFLLIAYALLILNSLINLLWLIIEYRIKRKKALNVHTYPSLFETSKLSTIPLLMGYFTLIVGVILSIDYSVNISLEKELFFSRLLFLLPTVLIYTYLMYMVFIKQDLGRKIVVWCFWAAFSLALPFLDSSLGQSVFHAN
ncbi:MAG: hypothetical protein KBC84_10570 [Proteobacteria bacterium]|nr:hypothetical protein [Pseudomonadota bacterium]